MHSVIHDTPKPIDLVNPDMPDWLCEIVDKLIEKNPDDRFQSAEEVEDLLARHLAHVQQPESVQQPERVGSSRAARGEQPVAETAEQLATVSSPTRRATELLGLIGGLDVIMCLALFFGIAPGFRGRDIPSVVAISIVLGGLVGMVLLFLTLIGRRLTVDQALPRPIGILGGILALLPFGPVHILAIPVSIWIVRVFRRQSQLAGSSGASADAVMLPIRPAAKWPTLYLALTAIVLLFLALEADSGFLSRNWLNLTGHGTIVVDARDAGVHVSLNGNPQSVDENGKSRVSVIPGVYVIRSTNRGHMVAAYLHEIRRGNSLIQQINDAATDVAIIGPVSKEMPEGTARMELLKKYSQPLDPKASDFDFMNDGPPAAGGGRQVESGDRMRRVNVSGRVSENRPNTVELNSTARMRSIIEPAARRLVPTAVGAGCPSSGRSRCGRGRAICRVRRISTDILPGVRSFARA